MAIERNLPAFPTEDDTTRKRELCFNLAVYYLSINGFDSLDSAKQVILAVGGSNILDIPYDTISTFLKLGINKAGIEEYKLDYLLNAIVLAKFYMEQDVRIPDRLVFVYRGMWWNEKNYVSLSEITQTIEPGKKVLVVLNELDEFSKKKEFSLQIPSQKTDFHGFLRRKTNSVPLTQPDLFVVGMGSHGRHSDAKLDVSGVENIIFSGDISSGSYGTSTFKGNGVCVIMPGTQIGKGLSNPIAIDMAGDVIQYGGYHRNTKIRCRNYIQKGGEIGLRSDGNSWRIGSQIEVVGGKYMYEGGEKADPLLVKIKGDSDWEITNKNHVLEQEHTLLNGSGSTNLINEKERFDLLFRPIRTGTFIDSNGRAMEIRQYTIGVSGQDKKSIDKFAEFKFMALKEGWNVEESAFTVHSEHQGNNNTIVMILTRPVSDTVSPQKEV